MSNQRLKQQKQSLVNAGFMEKTDELVENIPCSYAEQPDSGIKRWKSGWIYYTRKKIICMTGIIGNPIIIRYADICSVRKCLQGLIPMGIAVTYRNSGTGEVKEQMFSFAQRKKWMSYLEKNRFHSN